MTDATLADAMLFTLVCFALLRQPLNQGEATLELTAVDRQSHRNETREKSTLEKISESSGVREDGGNSPNRISVISPLFRGFEDAGELTGRVV